MLNSKKYFLVFTLAIFSSLFAFVAGVKADTVTGYTVSCQKDTGPLSSYSPGQVCDNGTDAYVTITNGTRVELLTNHFDDRGNISVASLSSGTVTSINSDGHDINLGSDGSLDITYLFTSGPGQYRVHFYAVDSTCCSVGGQAGIRVTYPTCASPSSPTCTSGASSCQTNGRCVDLGGGNEGCEYDEIVCNSPGACQTLPGSCFNGRCSYATSTESCEADSNPCTYDECISEDGGITARCQAGGSNLCSGIVPCGRLVDDPSTTGWNETDKCQVCHIVIMLSNIINFLMNLAIVLTVLGIIIVGFLSIVSSADVSTNVKARQKLNAVLSGFVVIFVSWLIVNTLMVLFGFNDPLGNDAWHILNCNL